MLKHGFRSAVFLFLIIFSFAAADLYASGSREDDFTEVEQLIEDKEYNAALRILTEYLKSNPERIDDVQGLLARIREEKERYNNRYEELIETYGGDDVEAAYPIIKELEELDPNPNEATRISLVLARETAGFVFNNNRWVDIMERASVQLMNKEYAAAAETYMEGFDLSRDIFRDAGYGNIVVNDIFSRTDRMNELALEFIELYPGLVEMQDIIQTMFILGNPDEYISEINKLMPEMQKAGEIREELKDLADYFIVQEGIIRNTAGDEKQVHYLIYMDRLLNGRTTVDESEGITGSIEIYWNSLFNLVAKNSMQLSEDLFTGAYSRYKDGDYNTAETAFGNASRISENSISFYEFGSSFLESDSEFAREGLLSYAEKSLYSDLLYLQQEYDTAEEMLTVMEKQRLFDNYNRRISALDDQNGNFYEQGALIKAELLSEGEVLESLLETAENRVKELELDNADDSELARSADTASIPADEYRDLVGKVLTAEIALTGQIFELEIQQLEENYIAEKLAAEESAAMISGIPGQTEVPDEAAEAADFEVLYKYPDRALEMLLAVETGIKTLTADIENVIVRIGNERPAVRNGVDVAAAMANADDLLNRSGLLLDEAVDLAAAAREQIFTAEKSRQEGERRIEDSKRLTRSGQFAVAKERLEQAAAKFDESLSYLEDPLLRAYRDDEIPRLYDEIQVAENNLVVRQVREYLTQGKADYSDGNFPAAQNVLIKAQSRWADTNIEPNPEVEYWLTLTKTALSVTSGRVIASTDPLFAEMSQYINKAREDFQNARDQYDQGNTDEADNYFARAEQSILYVQQFFPFNEEARVLNLRISQYRDPERFNELFRADFIEARNLISSNPQKAYIDLKDLEAINANYAGLKAAITEAEYAAGIKVRPPDPQKLQRSTELYRLAYDIVSRNVRSEFNVALSYLDEAISLNPDNNDAIRLKDRISTDVGGTAVVVMSNADQQLYNEAVSEYTAGNYLKARIIVENLLKNPVNQRNPKLIDLKERIDRTR